MILESGGSDKKDKLTFTKTLSDFETMKVQNSVPSDKAAEDELDDECISPSQLRKVQKPKGAGQLKSFSPKRGGTTCIFDSDFEDEVQKIRKTPIIFTKAKFIMKPLNQYVDEKQLEKSSNNGFLSNTGFNMKDKLTPMNKPQILGGTLQLGFRRQSESGATQRLSLISPKSLHEQSSPLNNLKNVIPSSPSWLGGNKTAKNEQKPGYQVDKVEDTYSINEEEQNTMRNIFNENVDLKSKQVSPLFNNGPRYGPDSELVKYTIVGKPEWYKKVDAQKNGNKLTTKNVKLTSGNNTTTNLNSKQQNFDMKSVISRQNGRKSTQKISEEPNIDGENGVIQIVTKDHILMKFKEIEDRLQQNAHKQEETINTCTNKKKSIEFQKEIDETKQERCLKTFQEQAEVWAQTANSILHRQEGSKNLLGKGKLSTGIIQKYHNYSRSSIDSTLLIRSEDAQRKKKEQNEYLDHLKEPIDVIGQKHLWESMLRNDTIDITTKYSQRHKIRDYFFPQNAPSTFGKQQHHPPPPVQISSTEDLHALLGKSQTRFAANNIPHKAASPRGPITDIDGNEIIAFDNSSRRKFHPSISNKIFQSSSKSVHLTSPQKIDLTFQKTDFTYREMVNTKGARIVTAKNYELLEVIRTPRIIHDSFANRNLHSTFGKETLDSKGFNSSRDGQTNYSSFMERTKLSSLRSTNSITNKQPYLDYFTSSDLDGIAIQGENKFQNEKFAIQNDGKQRFETYNLVIVDENKLKESKSPKDNHKAITKPISRDDNRQQKSVAHVSFISPSTINPTNLQSPMSLGR